MRRRLRGLGRRARAARGPAPSPDPYVDPECCDSWLEAAASDRLRAIDAACAGGGAEAWASFADLSVDVWALLLTQDYDAFPNIRALLPDVPDPALQQLWNGASGIPLAAQSAAFYARLRERYAEHGHRPLAQARVLDFGCGWGRLTRLLARDVAPGSLYGCDPVQQILDVCRAARVPARLARSDFLPERLPFDGVFDLAFAFSVFTHLSEVAHQCCLRALHTGLAPEAIVVVTVRPPAYLQLSELLHQALDSLRPDVRARLAEPRYLFAAHPAEPSHPQYDGGEMTYGETVVTLAYVRERWAPLFELLAVDVLAADPYQLMLTLRRVD